MAKELNNFRLHMFECGFRKVTPMANPSFDCQPQDLDFEHYKLGVIDDKAADEVAARILRLIQDEKNWVGISWDAIALLMFSDLVNKRKRDSSIATVFKLEEYAADEDGKLMATAANYLEKEGFIRVEEKMHEKEYYLFPTEKLVSLVPRKQK